MPEKDPAGCAKDDKESLTLSKKDAQFRNKWRKRIQRATG